jgi:hypothetical protein
MRPYDISFFPPHSALHPGMTATPAVHTHTQCNRDDNRFTHTHNGRRGRTLHSPGASEGLPRLTAGDRGRDRLIDCTDRTWSGLLLAGSAVCKAQHERLRFDEPPVILWQAEWYPLPPTDLSATRFFPLDPPAVFCLKQDTGNFSSGTMALVLPLPDPCRDTFSLHGSPHPFRPRTLLFPMSLPYQSLLKTLLPYVSLFKSAHEALFGSLHLSVTSPTDLALYYFPWGTWFMTLYRHLFAVVATLSDPMTTSLVAGVPGFDAGPRRRMDVNFAALAAEAGRFLYMLSSPADAGRFQQSSYLATRYGSLYRLWMVGFASVDLPLTALTLLYDHGRSQAWLSWMFQSAFSAAHHKELQGMHIITEAAVMQAPGGASADDGATTVPATFLPDHLRSFRLTPEPKLQHAIPADFFRTAPMDIAHRDAALEFLTRAVKEHPLLSAEASHHLATIHQLEATARSRCSTCHAMLAATTAHDCPGSEQIAKWVAVARRSLTIDGLENWKLALPSRCSTCHQVSQSGSLMCASCRRDGSGRGRGRGRGNDGAYNYYGYGYQHHPAYNDSQGAGAHYNFEGSNPQYNFEGGRGRGRGRGYNQGPPPQGPWPQHPQHPLHPGGAPPPPPPP